MDIYQQLIEALSELVLPERLQTFNRALDFRTRFITVVLEDIYQSQNASAVLRTCDVFGVQDIHIIEKRNVYNINPDITLGSQQWLTLKKYPGKENNSINTIADLRNNGYRIVATTPHTSDVELPDFDLTKGKVALFFGTERMGLTKQVIENADEYLKIPMFGFTESLNISVSAAIIIHQLTQKLHTLNNGWQLTNEERKMLLFQWLRTSVKMANPVIKQICQRNNLDYREFIR